MDNTFSKAFWDDLYDRGDTGWDLGAVSPPLEFFFDGLHDREMRILIPGCGYGHEAEHLHRKGFNKVYVLDISPAPLVAFRSRVPSFPAEHLLNEDFFTHRGRYELVVEQTFFCALLPEKRPDYIHKMHELLTTNGRLAGLLFDAPLNEDRPPFGGTEEEYRKLFEGTFQIDQMKPTTNSVEERQGRELFFLATRL